MRASGHRTEKKKGKSDSLRGSEEKKRFVGEPSKWNDRGSGKKTLKTDKKRAEEVPLKEQKTQVSPRLRGLGRQEIKNERALCRKNRKRVTKGKDSSSRKR